MSRAIVGVLVVAIFSGCGFALRLRAPDATHPVSASGTIFDADGGTLTYPGDFDVLQHFTMRFRAYGLFWGIIPLGDHDQNISASLDAAIATESGSAIVNLEVYPDLDDLKTYAVFGLIPFVPNVVTAVVEGDVVRVRPRAERQ